MIKNSIINIYNKACKIRNSILTRVSPKLANKVIYKKSQGKKLNLKNPKEFNEKLIYLKLNDYIENPIYADCTDKYKVREYVKKMGCEEILTKLCGKGVYSDARDINWDELPQKFVLKCTHGCGYNIICIDKDKLDKKATIKQLNKWLHKKYGYSSAETHYFKIEPKIICEEYLETEAGLFPTDYKIYCFHGEPKLIITCADREHELQIQAMDLNWNVMKNILSPEHTSKSILPEPENLKEMIEYAKKLSKPFKYVRVDLYNVDGKTIFGELTFTPAGCTERFPDEASKMLGDMLKL